MKYSDYKLIAESQTNEFDEIIEEAIKKVMITGSEPP